MQGTNQLVRSNWGLGVLLRDTSTRPGWDQTGNHILRMNFSAKAQAFLVYDLAPEGRWFDPRCSSHIKIRTAARPLSKALNPHIAPGGGGGGGLPPA